ncbi:hypothetical protein B7P43_G12339 [Cryptotermes secundus]|uniref:Pro-resilin n=1 Tax=Cryptotermes secundus TaxID=105785 RepID=A0A2J7QYK3_9NEOP|nr:pro-resilin [Cryptotermes secundus]PNF33654.1 hypothetical protein B7P43_G12339 [Cryptotermes secundus]
MVIHRSNSNRIWLFAAILATLFQLCFAEDNSNSKTDIAPKTSTTEVQRPKRQGYYRGGSSTGFGGLPTVPPNTYLPPKNAGGFGTQRSSGAFDSHGRSSGGEFKGPSLDTSSSFGSPAGGFHGSHNGPSNAYLPPGGGSTGFGSQSPEFGNKGPSRDGSSSTYSAPEYNEPSAGSGSYKGFPSGSDNFGGSPLGPSNSYLPPNSAGSQRSSNGFGHLRSSERNNFGRPSGSYGVPSSTSSRIGGRGPPGGSGSDGQVSDIYDAPGSGGGRFDGQHAGLRILGTNASPKYERNGFVQGPSGESPTATYGGPASNINRFGGQGSSGGSSEANNVPSSRDNGFSGQGSSGGSVFGRPSGMYDAQAAISSGFGRQGPSGESGFGRPSGSYGAPTSSGKVFSTQGTFVGRRLGSQFSETFGATASGSSGFGSQTHAGENLSSGFGAPSSNFGDLSHPSNVHISSGGGIGRHLQISGGIGSQSNERPSSFHNIPGLDGGYNGSPNGASNTYLPPASGGRFGGQGSPRNNGFGGQHGFPSVPISNTYSSSYNDRSMNGYTAFSINSNGNFNGQRRPSGSHCVPVAGCLSGRPDTYKVGGFTEPSNPYLPPGSSFNYRELSGSVSLGDPRPGVNGFSSSRDGTSNSYDNPSSDSPNNHATGFGRSSPGSSNTYSSSGSGRNYGPSGSGRQLSKLNQYGVPHPGGFGLRPQTANNGDHGPERNGSQRLPTSYNASNNGVVSGQPTSSHFPSQRQVYMSAFEGYKY